MALSLGLHDAVTSGNVDEVQRHIEAGADVFETGRLGQTALHIAARCSHDTIIQLLLANGADAQAMDDGREAPLHYAASNGHTAGVVTLLAAGSAVDATDLGGATALCHAVSGGHHDVVRLLLNGGSAPNRRERISIADLLLQAGADVNALGSGGHSALQWAANLFDTVQFLLYNGADVAVRHPEGCTALHGACSDSKIDVVRLLVRHGATLDAPDKDFLG